MQRWCGSMARYLKLTLFASLGFLVSVGFGRRKDRQGLMAQSGGSRHTNQNLVYVCLCEFGSKSLF